MMFCADMDNGPWAKIEGAPEVACSILDLRAVVQLHQQHCSICKDGIKALQALIRQTKGRFMHQEHQ